MKLLEVIKGKISSESPEPASRTDTRRACLFWEIDPAKYREEIDDPLAYYEGEGLSKSRPKHGEVDPSLDIRPGQSSSRFMILLVPNGGRPRRRFPNSADDLAAESARLRSLGSPEPMAGLVSTEVIETAVWQEFLDQSGGTELADAGSVFSRTIDHGQLRRPDSPG